MTTLPAYFANETRLAEKVASDPQAFIDLYDLYFKRVYNYIRYRCNDADTADDLTSQVFEAALKKITTYNPHISPFGAWLFGIARNAVNYHLRTQRGRQWLPIDSIETHPGRDPSPEEALILAESQRELLRALTTLNERERDLLGLKFGASLTNRRIAEITGLSESNVGIILYRAIGKLRITLGAKD